MQTFFDDIAEKVESGEYFKQAKTWYQEKYIYPVIERSFFLLITLVSVITSATAIVVLLNFLPLVSSVPIIIGINDTGSKYSKIYNLRRVGSEQDPNQILIKYFSGKYVEAYEHYNYEDNFSSLNASLEFVKRFSSQDMLEQYKYHVGTEHDQGLMLVYREHTKRKIVVLNNTFRFDPHRPGRLYVDFIITETTKYETKLEEKTSKWQAKIDFQFSDVTFNKEKGEFNPLDYKVVDYIATEIE